MDDDDAATREGRKIFVGNLSWDTTARSFESHFKTVPGVEGVEFKADGNGKPRGFGTMFGSEVL